jgi:hypothetical protein
MATTMERVLSVWSMLSLMTAGRRLGAWCEIASSLGAAVAEALGQFRNPEQGEEDWELGVRLPAAWELRHCGSSGTQSKRKKTGSLV